MKKYLGISLLVMFLVLFSFSLTLAQTNTGLQQKGCTMEAKQCPDGSFVGRTGPNCEFAKCPNEKVQRREAIKKDLVEAKNDLNKEKEQVRVNIQEKRTEIKEQIEKIKNASPEEKEQMRQEIQEKKEEIKKEIELTREEAKVKLENLKANIQTIKDKTKANLAQARIVGREEALKRFDQGMDRIIVLKDKVNTLISKLEAKKLDVQPAKDLVAKAEEKVSEAKQKVGEASQIFASTSGELSKENKEKLVILAKETQALIKEAHQALLDAIKYLKSIAIKPMPIVNTTVENVDPNQQ